MGLGGWRDFCGISLSLKEYALYLEEISDLCCVVELLYLGIHSGLSTSALGNWISNNKLQAFLNFEIGKSMLYKLPKKLTNNSRLDHAPLHTMGLSVNCM